MYRPFTFMVENVRYITLIGLEMNDTIKASDVVNFKNAMPFSVFASSKINPKMTMEKQAGCQLNGLPIIKPTEAVEKDGAWFVKGMVEDKPFELTDSAILVGGEVVCGEGQQQVAEMPTEEKAEPEPVKEETAPEPEPVKEETVPEPEPPQQSAEPESVNEEPAPEPEPEEVGTDHEPTPAPEPEPKEQPSLDTTEEFYGFKFGSGKMRDKPVILGGAVVEQSLAIGVELVSKQTYVPPHLRRREFEASIRPSTATVRYPWQRAEDMEEERAMPTQPYVPSGVPTVSPEPTEKVAKPTLFVPKTEPEQVEHWEQAEKLAPTVTMETPHTTPQEPVAPSADENKELKEAFRSTLSPEVNKIIGDIPHSILGSIEAFTTNDIDEKALQEQGEVYCIDRRWQKCGKWYCIDVVNHYSRYFFNPKLSVSIEIPTATCKEWLNIVTNNV